MKRMASLQVFSLAVAVILTLSSMLFGQQRVASHVRVVRLSYVSGTVGVKRPASTEWAKAQTNTPLQEGFEISTAAHSYAEVEFENGSTARLGEFSKLSFDQLAMDEDGNKLNRMIFEQGYATFHILPEHHDAYSVKIADSTLAPNGRSEFRTDVDRGKVRVEVFAGTVELTTASKKVKLGKDKVLEFDPDATELALNVSQGIVKDSWDKWSSERDTQTQLSLNDQAVGSGGSMYGWSDLGAYGEWGFFPGFGYGWSPYVSAGWSPYSMGMWSFYPGMGYNWISGEPWGWLPYHYGSWNFSPGFGWMWMPGNFGNYSPALVSWYAGPGWVGWAPRGAVGMVGQGIVTTVPASVVQQGQSVSSQNANHMPVAVGTRIRNLPFQPGAGAMLSGTTLSAGAESLFVPPGAATHTMAPDSILMGGSAVAESSLQGAPSSRQPLRVRMGNTLGGAYAVSGSVGEFRGEGFAGGHGSRAMNGSQGLEFSRSAGPGGPTLLPHGQQVAVMPSTGGRGGMMSSGSRPVPVGGGGSAGGGTHAMSAPSSGGIGGNGGGGHVAATSTTSGHH
jgi:hypothetical protein